MSEPNNQSNELSLDQLDGINGGTIEKVRFSVGGGVARGKAQAEGGMPPTTRSKDLLIGLA